MMQIEKQRDEYYKSLGTPPGVPTMKGTTADPDNTGRGYNEIIGDLGDHSVPEGWVQRPKFNEKGDVPDPWSCNFNCVKALFLYILPHLDNTIFNRASQMREFKGLEP